MTSDAAAGSGAPGSSQAAEGSSASKRQRTREEKPRKEEKPPPRVKEEKPAPPLPRVEVALDADGFANWYAATVIQETKTRCRADETDDYLLIVGRPKEEVVPTGSVRPIHPNEPSWTPQVGTRCEYLFAEGWWTVMVEKALKGNKWQVVYEPHQVTYKATRAELRRDTLRDP